MAVLWCCMWGRGPRRTNAACSALCGFSVTSPTTHNQIAPFWCWFLRGWACVRSRTLWVSPTNSPEDGSFSSCCLNPHSVFNQRFETLSPQAGAQGCWSILLPNCSSQFIYMGMWDCQVLQLPPCCESSLPSCLSLPLLLAWMNVSSLTPWLSDVHTVRFSVSSDCFLFLNLLLSFFWLCEEAQCVYLCLHLGQKSIFFFPAKFKAC